MLYAPGLHHLALTVDSREDVRAAHAAAVAAGAHVLHPPRTWPEYPKPYGVAQDHYATFFLDPDGFRLEIASARHADA